MSLARRAFPAARLRAHVEGGFGSLGMDDPDFGDPNVIIPIFCFLARQFVISAPRCANFAVLAGTCGTSLREYGNGRLQFAGELAHSRAVRRPFAADRLPAGQAHRPLRWRRIFRMSTPGSRTLINRPRTSTRRWASEITLQPPASNAKTDLASILWLASELHPDADRGGEVDAVEEVAREPSRHLRPHEA